jgi:hypothetical protein
MFWNGGSNSYTVLTNLTRFDIFILILECLIHGAWHKSIGESLLCYLTNPEFYTSSLVICWNKEGACKLYFSDLFYLLQFVFVYMHASSEISTFCQVLPPLTNI